MQPNVCSEWRVTSLVSEPLVSCSGVAGSRFADASMERFWNEEDALLGQTRRVRKNERQQCSRALYPERDVACIDLA